MPNKIAFLYADRLYQNFSTQAVQQEFRRRANDSLCVIDVSTTSAAEVRRVAATSDVVVIHDSIIIAGVYKERVRTAVAASWPHYQGGAFYWDLFQQLLEIPTLRVYFETSRDLHGPGIIEHEARFDAVIGWYCKEPLAFTEIPPAYMENFLKVNAGSNALVDEERLRSQYPEFPTLNTHVDPLITWQKVRKRHTRLIEFIHCLDETEFLPHPARKIWQLCIAGAPYPTRRIARRSAEQQLLLLAPYRLTDFMLRKSFGWWGKWFAPDAASTQLIKARQMNQEQFVKHARLNFVCGSGLKYPVRKFFEAPAAWSAMIAYPCTGFADYGFVDGQNVIVSEPQAVGATARRLLQTKQICDQLAKNGRETVHRLHRVEQRVTDLLTALTRLSSGQLAGAEFVAGRYEIY
ncbi:MAG: glycosyltransferase family protein [Caldilineaceae bacterium]